jgi:Tol biopolymer transport system component
MCLASVVASGNLASSAQAAFPGRNGRIAYTDDCSGLERIATMKPDGTRQRQLKAPACDDSSFHPERAFSSWGPSWAPDGRRLLFEYEVGAGSGFAVADADGSHRTVVPLAPPRSLRRDGFGEFDEFHRSGPSFAPDGRHVVYERYEQGGTLPQNDVWIATVDGREDRRLGSGSLPRWSPDGRTIAYVAAARGAGTAQEREGGTWLMSARTGKPLRRLWRRSASSLDWAPDGHRLVASPGLSVRGRGLYILRADGKAAQPLTSPSRRTRRQLREGIDAVWSPNGSRIAYVREQGVPNDDSGEFDRVLEIWTIGTRGARARRIWIRNDGFDSDSPSPPPLSWQPLAH